MAESRNDALLQVLRDNEQEILRGWLQLQERDLSLRNNLLRSGELEQQSRDFLAALRGALSAGDTDILTSEAWAPVRELMTSIARSRARQGFTPTETATFVFSLKQPLFTALRAHASGDDLAEQIWSSTLLLDSLGLLVTETYQKGREEVIARQQQELLELSTPVVQLWAGVLALPLIGTLDSARTQVVMESLLQAIVDTGSAIAIIDITGVPVVDTLVAQHLLKTVAAARLMGADCIISGIRPQIAQTIVHLGVEINDVITKATLADAFSIALQRLGLAVVRRTAKAV
ncbi:MAG: STAS domain-containing protein [Acidobacteria bacterium]|nr:STAS domain-containing protein [Acidobacteriota bacterium]MBV9477628.1 STAS domain-containing protein [Acidobacteriota bacterium]